MYAGSWEASKIDQSAEEKSPLGGQRHWCGAVTKRISGPHDQSQTCRRKWTLTALQIAKLFLMATLFVNINCFLNCFLSSSKKKYPLKVVQFFYRTTLIFIGEKWKSLITNAVDVVDEFASQKTKRRLHPFIITTPSFTALELTQLYFPRRYWACWAPLFLETP